MRAGVNASLFIGRVDRSQACISVALHSLGDVGQAGTA